jgi:hypothetical protein
METIAKNGMLWANVSGMAGAIAGTHRGIWSGYRIEFKIGEVEYAFDTPDGIRGISKCNVEISKSGEITAVTE